MKDMVQKKSDREGCLVCAVESTSAWVELLGSQVVGYRHTRNAESRGNECFVHAGAWKGQDIIHGPGALGNGQ